MSKNMIRVENIGGAGVHDLYFNDDRTGFYCSHSGQRGYIETSENGAKKYDFKNPNEA